MNFYSENQVHQFNECVLNIQEYMSKEEVLIKSHTLLFTPKAKIWLDKILIRRGVIGRCIIHIFRLSPMSQSPIINTQSSEYLDLMIVLHAVLINISAMMDNIAWLYKDAKNLNLTKHDVGLEKHKLKAHLPPQILSYLGTDEFTIFFGLVKQFRDALAHNHTPFVPREFFTKERTVPFLPVLAYSQDETSVKTHTAFCYEYHQQTLLAWQHLNQLLRLVIRELQAEKITPIVKQKLWEEIRQSSPIWQLKKLC
ncbi:MAG: hypothetical protein ACKO37_09140 [Vampirovibrionales bacterium]